MRILVMYNNSTEEDKMKKLLSILLICSLIFSQVPMDVLANSYDVGNARVVIDTTWTGSLEDVISGELGLMATDISELHITARGTLTDIDIIYINSMINLKILDISNAVTVVYVGDNFLYEFKYLTHVNLPKASTFGPDAFSSCSELKNIILPQAISLNEYAFSDCHKLERVEIPEVTEIAREVFRNCHHTIVLRLGASVPSVTGDTFLYGRGIVIVPVEKYEDYDNKNDGT